MGDKMHNLGANQACFIPCQRSIWTPLLQVHLRGCGHVVSWERCQHLSDFVPCSNLLAVYIAYLGWAELLAEISGLFGLEPNIFEVTLLIYKDCAHSPFAHPSRNWAAGRGSCSHSSMEQCGLWQSLTKLCLLRWDSAWCFFSPLFSFSDCFTSSLNTQLCAEHYLDKQLCPQVLCTKPCQSLCTGPVILLTSPSG